MAKPWADVAASPEYQKLSPDQREAARGQYFDSVVAPKVPKESLGAARQQFDAKTGPARAVARDISGPEEPSRPGFLEGVNRGYKQMGLGLIQAAGALGVPTVLPKEAIADTERRFEEQGRGTGAAGLAGELVGSSPALLLGPMGKAGAALKLGGRVWQGAKAGALGGGLAGFTAPTSNKDDTILNRLGRAGLGAAAGAGLGAAVPAAGAFAKSVGRKAEGIYNEYAPKAAASAATLAKFAGRKVGGLVNEYGPYISEPVRKAGGDIYELAKATGDWANEKTARGIKTKLETSVTRLVDDILNSVLAPKGVATAEARSGSKFSPVKYDVGSRKYSPASAPGTNMPNQKANLMASAYGAARSSAENEVSGLYGERNKIGSKLAIPGSQKVAEDLRNLAMSMSEKPFSNMDPATTALNAAGDNIFTAIDKLAAEKKLLTVADLEGLKSNYINERISKAERSGNDRVAQEWMTLKNYIGKVVGDRIKSPDARGYAEAAAKADTAYTDFQKGFEGSKVLQRFGLSKDLFMELQGKGSKLSSNAMNALKDAHNHIKTPDDLVELKETLMRPDFVQGSYNKRMAKLAFEDVARKKLASVLEGVVKDPSKIIDDEKLIRGLLQATGQSGKSGSVGTFVKAMRALEEHGIDLSKTLEDKAALNSSQVTSAQKAAIYALMGHKLGVLSKLKDVVSGGSASTQEQALLRLGKKARQQGPNAFNRGSQAPAEASRPGLSYVTGASVAAAIPHITIRPSDRNR